MERWRSNRINFQKPGDGGEAATEEQADAVAEDGAKFLGWITEIVEEVAGSKVAEKFLSDLEKAAEAKLQKK
jgi:hypothetical protein